MIHLIQEKSLFEKGLLHWEFGFGGGCAGLDDLGHMFSDKSQRSNGNLLFTGNRKIGPEKMLHSAQLTV